MRYSQASPQQSIRRALRVHSTRAFASRRRSRIRARWTRSFHPGDIPSTNARTRALISDCEGSMAGGEDASPLGFTGSTTAVFVSNIVYLARLSRFFIRESGRFNNQTVVIREYGRQMGESRFFITTSLAPRPLECRARSSPTHSFWVFPTWNVSGPNTPRSSRRVHRPPQMPEWLKRSIPSTVGIVRRRCVDIERRTQDRRHRRLAHWRFSRQW